MQCKRHSGLTTFGSCLIGQLFSFAFIFTFCLSAAQAQKSVWVDTVLEQSMQPRQKVSGNIRAKSDAVIAALEEGAILEVMVKAGDRVTEGTPIAELDVRRLEAEREMATAELQYATSTAEFKKAELETAKTDYDSYQKVFEKQAISEQFLREAKTEFKVARAQYRAEVQNIEAIKSRIKQIDIRLADAVVKAPFDGIVTQRHAEQGEWIKPGEPIVNLISSGGTEAWLEVPERFAKTILLNSGEQQSVTIYVNATGESVSSEAVRMIPQIDQRSRMFYLVVDLSKASSAVSPGMSISGWIPVGENSEVMTVHRDALVRSQQGSHVYKVVEHDGKSTAQRVPISVLFETEDQVAVSSRGALSKGDMVIVEGNERLMPGEVVIPTLKNTPMPTKGDNP